MYNLRTWCRLCVSAFLVSEKCIFRYLYNTDKWSFISAYRSFVIYFMIKCHFHSGILIQYLYLRLPKRRYYFVVFYSVSLHLVSPSPLEALSEFTPFIRFFFNVPNLSSPLLRRETHVLFMYLTFLAIFLESIQARLHTNTNLLTVVYVNIFV